MVGIMALFIAACVSATLAQTPPAAKDAEAEAREALRAIIANVRMRPTRKRLSMRSRSRPQPPKAKGRNEARVASRAPDQQRPFLVDSVL
jgi:hypothetical protein